MKSGCGQGTLDVVGGARGTRRSGWGRRNGRKRRGEKTWNVKKGVCRTGSDLERQGLIGKGTKVWRN